MASAGAWAALATFVTNTSYSYDLNGNLAQVVKGGTTRTLTWDAENRLTQIADNGQTIAQLWYDGDGNRGKKTEGGQTTLYLNTYYEKNLSTGEATKYYYHGGRLVALRKGSDLRYVFTDALGSVVAVVDTSGNLVGKQLYKPYGEAYNSTGTLTTDKKYTWQRLDGSGLYFYNARYYDAALGRFISPDVFVQHTEGFDLVSSPLTLSLVRTGSEPYPRTATDAPLNPQTLNRYTNLFQNPAPARGQWFNRYDSVETSDGIGVHHDGSTSSP